MSAPTALLCMVPARHRVIFQFAATPPNPFTTELELLVRPQSPADVLRIIPHRCTRSTLAFRIWDADGQSDECEVRLYKDSNPTCNSPDCGHGVTACQHALWVIYQMALYDTAYTLESTPDATIVIAGNGRVFSATGSNGFSSVWPILRRSQADFVRFCQQIYANHLTFFAERGICLSGEYRRLRPGSAIHTALQGSLDGAVDVPWLHQAWRNYFALCSALAKDNQLFTPREEAGRSEDCIQSRVRSAQAFEDALLRNVNLCEQEEHPQNLLGYQKVMAITAIFEIFKYMVANRHSRGWGLTLRWLCEANFGLHLMEELRWSSSDHPGQNHDHVAWIRDFANLVSQELEQQGILPPHHQFFNRLRGLL